MTEGGDGVKSNVSDEWHESQRRGDHEKDPKKAATERAVEKEAATEDAAPGTGGTKENVRDEWDESQEH